MSKPILEFLEALGIDVKRGAAKMECPSCHELKLTASEKKNVATCWACNKRFIPGDKRDNATPRWQARVMNAIASRCLKNLPERENTLNYLVKKRKLPADVAWLQANGVGSVPDRLPIDQLKELAEKVLGEDMKLACAGAGSAQLKALKDLENLERENIRDFFRTLTGVMNSADVPGAVAFIYTNHRGHCTSINCRLHSVESRGKAKQIRRIQTGTERGLFNPLVSLGSRWEDEGNEDEYGLPPIIVEGEFNWLSVLAINDEWSQGDKAAYGLMGCAMGGKNGADGKEVKLTFEETPLVIYDRDTLQEDGLPAGFDLVREINKHRAVYACATIGGYEEKDLDDRCTADNINRWRLTEKTFLEHWEKAVWLPRPYKEVGNELNAALGGKPGRVNYSKATEILWDDLQDRSECFRVKAGAGSFGIMVIADKDENLKDRNRIVQVLKGHPSWVSLMLDYGVGASDSACEKLGAEVAAHIQLAQMPFRELHLLSHYSTANKCLYIDELTHTLKLHPNGAVSYIQNGEEGVVFTPGGDARKAVIGEIGSLRVRDGEFTEQILGSVRWDWERGLSVEAAKQLYKMHVLSIFFDTLMEARVVPVFEGKAGGGKNTISNLTGRIFEGKDFKVLPMPDDPDKLETLTVDRLYCAFDEFDTSKPEVEKAFRSWCTRNFSERRELYNTWTTSVRPLARGMAVSTNSNPVRDVATGQRQLMFNVLPRQTAVDEEAYKSLGGNLYPEFMKHRNHIWSEIVADLRAMVMHINRVGLSISTSFRMGDFAVLFLAGAIAEGWDNDARAMLLQMQQTQLKELASKHTLVSLMTDYLTRYPLNQGRFFTQGEWKSRLRDHVAWGDKQTLDKITDGHLRTMFTGKSSDIMKSSFTMEDKPDKKLRQQIFSFALKTEKTDLAGVCEENVEKWAGQNSVLPDMESLDPSMVF